MKKTNLIDFADLLSYAEEIGYSWNKAHDILVKSDYCAMYGCQNVYLSDIDEIDCEDTKKIIKGFCKEEKIKEFTIAPKGG